MDNVWGLEENIWELEGRSQLGRGREGDEGNGGGNYWREKVGYEWRRCSLGKKTVFTVKSQSNRVLQKIDN